jgi:cyclopropane fatty-acyl-phospholipid synthase-like methyltransferase
MNTQVKVPVTSADFDKAYGFPITVWGDIRIPNELKELVKQDNTDTILELGCGVGRFSRYLAKRGFAVTGVDFSPVAIAKARKKTENDGLKPEFIVASVTNLDKVNGPFDVAFDVGCFHCLDKDGQKKYVSEVRRILKPGGVHLIWALDDSPSDISLSPASIGEIFKNGFNLKDSAASRRRIAKSHWYWLARK